MSREQYASMPVHEVPEGSTASILRYEFITDGVADDLSAATGDKHFYAKTLGGVQVVDQGIASWATDGSDGLIDFTLGAAMVGFGTAPRDLICDFEIEEFNGGELVSKPFIIRVTKRAKVV